MKSDNPILNNPYEEPNLHYSTDADGSLNYNDIRKGRRIFVPDIQAIPARQGPQPTMFDVNEYEEYGTHLINLCRKEIGKWRAEKYPNTTRVTKELLQFWLENLNARLIITNYHTFESKILQGNKRNPFEGKVNLEGEKIAGWKSLVASNKCTQRKT